MSVPIPTERERSPIPLGAEQAVGDVLNVQEAQEGNELESAEEKEFLEDLERSEQKVDSSETIKRAPLAAPMPQEQRRVPAKEKIVADLEGVLEEDLKELFLSLDKSKQQQFKQKGEEIVAWLRVQVATNKLVERQLLDQIHTWLKIVPDVNRFFLEQIAKIKTDKILIVIEEEKRRGLI